MHQVSRTVDSITLSWSQPDQPNGVILDYELQYYEKVAVPPCPPTLPHSHPPNKAPCAAESPGLRVRMLVLYPDPLLPGCEALAGALTSLSLAFLSQGSSCQQLTCSFRSPLSTRTPFSRLVVVKNGFSKKLCVLAFHDCDKIPKTTT